MAALTGNSVASSYSGLLKTTDNAAIDGNLKNMTDGLGNATPLSMANNYVQLQAPTIELIESTGGTNLMMIDPTQVYFEGNVDFTNASVTGLGGGGTTLGLYNTTRGIVMNNSAETNSKFMWRVTYNSDSYATSSFNVGGNTLYATAMSFAEGELVDKFGVYVRTAGTTLKGAIYSAVYDANGNYAPGNLLYDFGQIDTSTTGLKVITNANYTLGSTVDNVYFLCMLNDSATTTGILAVSSTQLSGPIYHASMYATTSYRGNTYHTNTGGTLPASLSGYTFNVTAAFPQYGVAR